MTHWSDLRLLPILVCKLQEIPFPRLKTGQHQRHLTGLVQPSLYVQIWDRGGKSETSEDEEWEVVKNNQNNKWQRETTCCLEHNTKSKSKHAEILQKKNLQRENNQPDVLQITHILSQDSVSVEEMAVLPEGQHVLEI